MRLSGFGPQLPVVSRPALELDGLTQAEIDSAVATRLRSGESLYLVDEDLLRALEPDVILTQDLCQVCAPSGNELSRAITTLPSRPDVLYLTPRTLAEIDENILAVGRAIGRKREARRSWVESASARGVRAGTRDRPRGGGVSRVDGSAVLRGPLGAGDDRDRRRQDPFGRPGADSVRITCKMSRSARDCRRRSMRIRARRR